MAVLPLDVLRVVMEMSEAGQTMLNVYEVIHAGSVSVEDTDVIAAIQAWLAAAYGDVNPYITDDLSYELITIDNITRDLNVAQAPPLGLTTGGESGTVPGPLQVAGVVRFPTNYRGSQLRKFVPGIAESAYDAYGVLTASAQAGLAGFGLELVNGFVAGGQEFRYGKDNTLKARFATAQGVIVNDVLGTQRRRTQGVGI